MRILVYGGTGYIGSHLIECLINKNYCVANVGRRKVIFDKVVNYSVHDEMQVIIKEFAPEKIIYLSACFDNENIGEIVDVNIKIPLEILNCINKMDVKAEFIYIGSYWQFGDQSSPDIPIDIYSASKKAMASFLDYYNEYTDISCKEIVLYGTYGGSDRRGKLLDYMINSANKNQQMTLSEGRQLLNLVEISDVCENIEITIGDTESNKFQILSDKCYTPRELVSMINNLKKVKVKFGSIPYRKVELMTPFNNPDYKMVYVKDSVNDYMSERILSK